MLTDGTPEKTYFQGSTISNDLITGQPFNLDVVGDGLIVIRKLFGALFKEEDISSVVLVALLEIALDVRSSLSKVGSNNFLITINPSPRAVTLPSPSTSRILSSIPN